MTSYFWSGFPSLSGRSDVMYGRRHIGGATHPLRHPYRLGLLRYRFVYRPGLILSPTTVSISFKVLSQLTNRFYRCQARVIPRNLSMRNASVSSSRFVPGARTKSKLVFDLMAMRNYASQPYIAYACTANWPGRARAVRRVHFNY